MYINSYLKYIVNKASLSKITEEELLEIEKKFGDDKELKRKSNIQVGLSDNVEFIAKVISTYYFYDIQENNKYEVEVESYFKLDVSEKEKEDLQTISDFVHIEASKSIKLIVREIIKNLSSINNEKVLFLPMEF